MQGILSHTPLKFTCDLWRFFASRKSTLGMSSLSHGLNFICCFLSRTSNRYTPTCCCTILLKWFQMPPKIQVQEDHDDLLCVVIQCNPLPPHAAGLLQTLEPNNIFFAPSNFCISSSHKSKIPQTFLLSIILKSCSTQFHILFSILEQPNSCNTVQNLVCTLHPSTFFYVY